MTTDQPVPTVLLIVDPESVINGPGQRSLLRKWSDKVVRLAPGCSAGQSPPSMHSNRAEKGGYHFSNETVDRRGQWQPLHKLVFLRRVDKRLNPIPTCARACRPATPATTRAGFHGEPGFMAARFEHCRRG